MYLNNIPLDEIDEPSRDEKLHPEVNEDYDAWEEFKASIGDEPDKPLDVRKNGDGYELIDGDRRLRALRNNNETDDYDIETVQCRVFEELSDEEFYLRRIRANEFRADSDPDQKAMYAAQFCAPWLLLPAERWGVERKTHSEFEDETTRLTAGSGGANRWLDPQRNKRPLRDILGSKKSGRQVSDEEIELIDEIVDLLRNRKENGYQILVEGEGSWVADRLDVMDGVSLGEIKQAAEKAREEEWKSDTLVETIQEEFAEDKSGKAASAPVKKGPMAGDDVLEDRTPKENYDEPNQPGSIETDADDPQPEPKTSIPDETVIDVNWADHLDDDDLPGDNTVEALADQNFVTLNVDGEAAVAIRIIATLAEESNDDVMSKFFAEGMVEDTVAFLQDLTAETVAQTH